MILITGSTGHLGRATIDFLLGKVPANQIAALARDPQKAAELTAKGVDVRIGNYNDYDSLVTGFTGIDQLLLISSSDFTGRVDQHINAINAAKEAGVKHIIYTGAANQNIPDSAIPALVHDHFKTAEYLKNSGITYTLMNNNLYADVLPRFIGDNVVETGIFYPAGDGSVPFATRSDMAEAVANVLTGEGHENKEYTIASDILYSFTDIAGILSELSDRQVHYINPSKAAYTTALTEAGVPEMYIGIMASFGDAIKANEFHTPDNTLEKLLGRKPDSLKTYLKSAYFPNN